MKKVKLVILFANLIAMVLMTSGCASIVTRSRYPISIESTPSNASIVITNKKGKEVFYGNTPAVVKLRAGAGFFTSAKYEVKFSKEGFNDKIVPIEATIDGWYFGNLMVGGILGMLIIDPATGAMWRINTKYLNETLAPSVSFVEPEIKIFSIDQVPVSWRQHLVKINEPEVK